MDDTPEVTERKVPGYWGYVKYIIQDGCVVTVEINETKKLDKRQLELEIE